MSHYKASKYLFGLFLILFIFLSCEDKSDPVEPVLDWRNLDLSQDFKTGSRNGEGIDPEKFEEGITIAKSLTGFHTIGVVYKGRLVTEEYTFGD